MDETAYEDRIGWLDREPEYWDLLGEVLELQETADASVGRNPYADLAVEETGNCPTQGPTHEHRLMDEELDDQVVQAARQVC